MRTMYQVRVEGPQRTFESLGHFFMDDEEAV